MTTAEASQVGGFHLGKGCFDLLIRERHIHPLQPLVDGMGGDDKIESSACSCAQCIVMLSLIDTQSSLVIS